MTVHAYPPSAMAGDYLRAAGGFVPSAAILATTPVGPLAAIVLAGLAALFGLFGIRTFLRQATRIELTETGLCASGPLRRAIAWDALDHLKLAYYATGRDRKNGWMQLELRAGASRLQFDSRIDGFFELVERAVAAAASRGLPLTDATLANLNALGLAAPEAQMRAPARARA
jgi:hypothetical protein